MIFSPWLRQISVGHLVGYRRRTNLRFDARKSGDIGLGINLFCYHVASNACGVASRICLSNVKMDKFNQFMAAFV